jgi:putative FmdB family regulatory protein
MPLYEFSCAKCGEQFEELVMSSKPEAIAKVVCPECGSPKVKKKVSTFASGVSGGASTGASAASCAPSGGG